MAIAQNVADEARGDLNDGDASNYRWSDTLLLRFINAAIRQIVMLLPSANVVEEVVTPDSNDPRRSLPAGGVKFLGAWNYDSEAATRGPALTVIEFDSLDSSFPEWSYPDHQGAYLNNYPTNAARHANVYFEHVMHDPRDPKTYYLFPPPVPGGDASYLGTSGVLSGNISQSAQTVTSTYALPAGTSNRMIVATVMINTATAHRDVSAVTATYGGVALNQVAVTLAAEAIDGADIGMLTFMLSVNGETFANDDLVIDGTAWDGTFAAAVYPVRAQVFVYDNIDPLGEDFSYGSQTAEVQTATNTLAAVTAADGDILFSWSMAGMLAGGTYTPTTDDLEITTPATLTFTYDDDVATTTFRGTFMVGRVGWATATAASYGVVWTMTNGAEIDNTYSWASHSLILPYINASSTKLLLRYSKIPTALTALANTFPLGDEYLNAAVEYTKYRMLAMDGRFSTSSEKRLEQWNNFRMALGLKPEVERRVDPARGRAGADDNG